MARLRALGAEYPLDITSKAFLLRPDTPPEGKERPLRPGEEPGKLSPQLQAAADDAGLTKMRRPSRTPNSLLPMQAMHHAKETGQGDTVRDAFYSAYWDDGLDIGQMDAIRQVTEACGLDWGPLSEALAESRHLSSVLAEYQEGLDLGFDGIPAFVFGDMKFTGAQPMAMFRRLAERASAMLAEDANAFTRKRPVL